MGMIFPFNFPGGFPPQIGSWTSDIQDLFGSPAVVTIDFVGSYITGSSLVEFFILDADNGSVVVPPTVAVSGSNNVDIGSSVNGREYRVVFRLSGDPDVGNFARVHDFSTEAFGNQIQFLNMGSDVELSTTLFNRAQFIPDGSFVNLLQGSFSTNGGSTWTPAAPNEEVTLPVSEQGSELIFRGIDPVGSVTLTNMVLTFKQDDF